MLKNRSLTVQFAFVFLVALALVGAAFYLILDRIYVNQLRSQAETVADNVDAFGSWVAQYGRVWVKDDNKSYLGHASLLQPEEGTPEGTVPPPGTKLTPVDFYSKNPGARATRILRGRRALAVAVQVPAHVAQRDESRTTRRTRSRKARCARFAPTTSRNTTSSPTTGFATRAPSIRRHRASHATATRTTRPTTSRYGTARPTASASRKATSPASSASACPRSRSGTWRSTWSVSGSS